MLTGASETSKATALTVTMTRPKTMTSFYELIHLFVMAVISLGLANSTIVMKFLDDVVWGAIRLKEKWETAFELLLIYLNEIDMDPTKNLNMGNAYKRGGQDTYLTEARRNAEAFFRTRGGTPPGERPPAGGRGGVARCRLSGACCLGRLGALGGVPCAVYLRRNVVVCEAGVPRLWWSHPPTALA